MEECIRKFESSLIYIIEKPSMYSINKVEDIYIFSIGFQFALNKNEAEELSEYLSLFQDFVNMKFESKETINWCRLIRYYSDADLGSLKLFERLFQDFKNSL